MMRGARTKPAHWRYSQRKEKSKQEQQKALGKTIDLPKLGNAKIVK